MNSLYGRAGTRLALTGRTLAAFLSDATEPNMSGMITSGATVLFQGDSITDAGRSRDDFSNLGRGYPHYLQGLIGAARAADGITFLNRGISGNRIVARDSRPKISGSY